MWTNSVNGSLEVIGTLKTESVYRNVKEITGNYTIQSNDHIIIIKGNGTVTIPQCTIPMQGRELMIIAKDTNGSTSYQTQWIFAAGSLNMHSSTSNLAQSVTLICNDWPNQSTAWLRTRIQLTRNP
jgi:hypothetical protein